MDTNQSKPKSQMVNEAELTEQELESIVAGNTTANCPGQNSTCFTGV